MRHQAASDDEALVSAAKAGDANAAFRLYELSEQRGDHRDAERWLGRAADDGHAEALYRLAQPESNGEMSRKHLNMMRQAAAAGHADHTAADVTQVSASGSSSLTTARGPTTLQGGTAKRRTPTTSLRCEPWLATPLARVER